MSIESNTEEVNLSYISKNIEKGFKNFLKICISVCLFYKRKWLLFLGLLLAGAIGGYFLDTTRGYAKKYTQEIIIEPKYDTKEYIYDFVNTLQEKIRTPLFLKKANLDTNSIKSLKSIEIKPIIRAADVLDNLHLKYGDKEYFYHIIEKYDAQALENEQYKNFYKYHRLIFSFRDKDPKNVVISNKILEYIRANDYYKKILTQSVKQTKKNLKKNKETLKYIEEYLDKLNKASIENKNDLIMIGKESEIPTVATLLARKQTLLNTITNQENSLILNNELFDIVETGDVIFYKVGILQKMMFRTPILLILLVSVMFLLRQVPEILMKYINS